MKKKYYYDCPIQALYMQKEFGVKFYTIHKSDFSDKKLSFHVDIKNIYNVLIQLLGIYNQKLSDNKIYVAPESEHIFEPKKGDEGRWARKIGAHYANYNGEQWVSAGIEEKLPDIIYRNGKHFFMPKEEN